MILAHRFRGLVHGKQSLPVWGWGKSRRHAVHMCRNKAFHHRISGLGTREGEEGTREQMHIQLKASSQGPTSATKSQLVEFPPPSED